MHLGVAPAREPPGPAPPAGTCHRHPFVRRARPGATLVPCSIVRPLHKARNILHRLGK
jgi:hypothetical protein